MQADAPHNEAADRSVGDPLTLRALRDHVARRLDAVPSLRWRIQPVPFRLHRPVYVNDPDFDLADHLEHVTLGGPGQPARLDDLLAATGARLLGPTSVTTFASAAVDSRNVVPGCCFVALRGERTDGHRFAADPSVDGTPVPRP